MQKKLINSQLSNFKTYNMYYRQMLALAQTSIKISNLPKFIDKSYLNKKLIYDGVIAFFVDEVMGLLALPYINLSSLDVYGRPNKIQVISQNGYTKKLNRDEFVIMYDNEGRYPLYLDILQYGERMALIQRTIDINIYQQRTPRFWKTTQEKVNSLKTLLASVDSFEETVVSYDNFIEDIENVLNPAPFVSDKLQEQKEKIWNEYLRLIGISNVTYEKKERQIKDEVQFSMGGTVASRSNRFETRQDAVEEINEKFGKYLEKPLEVEFYDGLPSTLKEIEKNFDINGENKEKESEENV